jgi:hypothetical protein
MLVVRAILLMQAATAHRELAAARFRPRHVGAIALSARSLHLGSDAAGIRHIRFLLENADLLFVRFLALHHSSFRAGAS